MLRFSFSAPGCVVVGIGLIGWALPNQAQELGSTADVSIATVGGREIGQKEIRTRFLALAPFQRRSLGQTWAEQRRRLLLEILIPEARFKQASCAFELGSKCDKSLVRGSIATERAFAQGVRAAIWNEVAAEPIGKAEVEAYYEGHLRFFEKPRAHLLWRILVSTRAKAVSLLAELGTAKSRSWRKIVRAESLDEATNMRSGSLGYVQRNGHTHRPQVRVDPNLFLAANVLSEHTLVPNPVAEGNLFAVIWRKATREAQSSELAAVEGRIRRLLMERHYDQRFTELLDSLRQAHLSSHHPEFLLGASDKFWSEQTSSLVELDVGAKISPQVRDPTRVQGRLAVPRAGDLGLR